MRVQPNPLRLGAQHTTAAATPQETVSATDFRSPLEYLFSSSHVSMFHVLWSTKTQILLLIVAFLGLGFGSFRK